MAENENRQERMDEGMKRVKTPSLTLEPEENEPEKEPKMKEPDGYGADDEEEASAGSVSESMLTDEEREQVEAFEKQIDVTNIKMINSYGAGAQNGIAAFSASITGNTKTKEFGEIGESLSALCAAINSTSATEKEKRGFFGLFRKGKQQLETLIANYESAETNIKKIEKDLQRYRQILVKDVYVFDQMYDQNLAFYKELTMYIIAGRKALKRAQTTRLEELRERAEKTRDQLDIQNYHDYENACNRFEKRLSDLETTRLVSIQMAPQIRLLQNSDQDVADKLRADVINTIPMWRNQMVLALGIEHSRRALDAQRAVTNMTNEMFRRNAETLKQGAIDAAAASEKAIVDVETLKKVNADIISSINEVVKIHAEGTKKRQEAREELEKIEDELKTALLEAGQKI